MEEILVGVLCSLHLSCGNNLRVFSEWQAVLLEHAHGHEWFDANNLYAHIVHLATTFSAVGLDRPHGYAGLWHRNSSALVLTFFPTTWNRGKIFALERKHLRRIPALYSRTCGADPGGYDVALGLVPPIP